MKAKRNGTIRFFRGTGLGSCKRTIIVNVGDDLDVLSQRVKEEFANVYDFVEVGSWSKWSEEKSLDAVFDAVETILS
jgi:hypothetical protein